MAVLMTEFIIKDMIENKMKHFADSPELFDEILYDGNTGGIKRIKELFSKSERIPKTIIGYPREPAQLPCYAIILGASTQQDMGLGNNLDVEEYGWSGEIKDYVENVKIENIDGYSCLQLSEIISDIKSINYNGEELEYVITNTEKGIVLLKKVIEADEIVTVVYNYYTKAVRTRGAMFQETYRIECWSDNGELTSLMFQILKISLLSSVNQMTENGFILPTLNGQDLEPAFDYMPVFVFRRSLNLVTRIENSWEEYDEAINIRSYNF